MLAGHFNEEPGICSGAPVIGERTPETMAKVVGERGNELEGVGGVAEAEERAENGKKESEEIVDVVVVRGECGEVGELGIEIGLEKRADTTGILRGDGFNRFDAGSLVPGSSLIILAVK